MRRPCVNCPWREDVPIGAWEPERFLNLARTCQGDGIQIMLCHFSKDPTEQATICQGWARALKFDAIGVRIAMIYNLVTADEVNDEGGPKLFGSFAEMLRANGIDVEH